MCVQEGKLPNGTTRVRIEDGWVSTANSQGEQILKEVEGDEDVAIE